MKTAAGLAIVVATVATAQSLPGDLITRLHGVGLNDCQVNCVATSVTDRSCTASDLECACKTFQGFADAILACNTNSCSSDDKGLAQRIAGYSCSGVIPIDGSSTYAPPGETTTSGGDAPTYSAPPPPTYSAPPPPTYGAPPPTETYSIPEGTSTGYANPPPYTYTTGDVSAPPPVTVTGTPTYTDIVTDTGSMSIPETTIGTMTSDYHFNSTIVVPPYSPPPQGSSTGAGSMSTSVITVGGPSYTAPPAGTGVMPTGTGGAQPTLQPTAAAIRPAVALGAVAAALFAL